MTGGGTFDAADKYLYFIAGGGGPVPFGSAMHEYILIAVNEVESEGIRTIIETAMDEGKRVFLDSGVYNLAMTHARNHGVSHDVALNLPPDQIDGFHELYKNYVEVVSAWERRLWGYIEIDQGGAVNKRKTRAKLNALGLNPIPVYHPFGDGWDYFDELATTHDRICLGNIVRAPAAVRTRLLATVMHRKRAYPHLWVHTLGLTPNAAFHSMPTESCDSSTWLSTARWSGYNERSCGSTLGALGKAFQYRLGSEAEGDDGHQKGWMMGAYGSYHMMRNLQGLQGEFAQWLGESGGTRQ